MSKISGQLLISGQFQDNCEISGISGPLGALLQSTEGTCGKWRISIIPLKGPVEDSGLGGFRTWNIVGMASCFSLSRVLAFMNCPSSK